LLTIEGELDDISGAGQTRAAHELCSGIPDEHRFHYDAEGAGHYGIFSGRRWREMVYPRVRSFIADYDKGAVAAPRARAAAAHVAKAPARSSAKASATRPSSAAARRR
jgi:poly(3-hydroxybutyrate) depolymerase